MSAEDEYDWALCEDKWGLALDRQPESDKHSQRRQNDADTEGGQQTHAGATDTPAAHHAGHGRGSNPATDRQRASLKAPQRGSPSGALLASESEHATATPKLEGPAGAGGRAGVRRRGQGRRAHAERGGEVEGDEHQRGSDEEGETSSDESVSDTDTESQGGGEEAGRARRGRSRRAGGGAEALGLRENLQVEDLGSLTVQELKMELKLRSLPQSGKKEVLVGRLQRAMEGQGGEEERGGPRGGGGRETAGPKPLVSSDVEEVSIRKVLLRGTHTLRPFSSMCCLGGRAAWWRLSGGPAISWLPMWRSVDDGPR